MLGTRDVGAWSREIDLDSGFGGHCRHQCTRPVPETHFALIAIHCTPTYTLTECTKLQTQTILTLSIILILLFLSLFLGTLILTFGDLGNPQHSALSFLMHARPKLGWKGRLFPFKEKNY